MSAETDRLREAAQRIRDEAPTSVMAAVADWLLAEAAVVEVIPPFTELLWQMRIEFDNGLASTIEVGGEADNHRLLASSTSHGMAVADAVLGISHRVAEDS